MSDPVFTLTSTNPFGLNDVGSYASPTLIDIDGDGDLDAFVGERYGNTLFYRNTGTASNPAFAAAVTNPFGFGDVGAYASPTLVDTDGDGDLDAFVGNSDGNILFFINNINGNQAPTATNLSAAEAYTEDTALDLKDIVVSDIDSANIIAILTLSNTAAGSLNAATSGTVTSVYNAGTGVWTASGALADVNALLASVTFTPAAFFNGNFTVSTSISDGVAAAITGSKNFTMTPGVAVHITQSDGATAVTEGGATDTYTVVLGSAPTANVTITLDNSNQQVTSDIGNLIFTPANWNIAQTVTVTAVNDAAGEGKHKGVIQHTVSSPDANYNNLAANPVVVAITDNDLPAADPVFTLTSTNPFGLSDVGYFASPTLVDMDGDGDLDALIGNSDGNTLFFRNTGTASSPAFAAVITNPFGLSDVGFSASPTLVDIDGDGDLDAFVGNHYGNTLFFRNMGIASNPAFSAASTNPFGLSDVGFSASPTFVDIDSDGDLDAFVGETYGNTLFFRNTGTASSPAFAAAVTNPFGLSNVGYNASPTLVDIDGDSDLDAFVGNYDGNTLFFRNTGTVSSPAFAAAVTNPFGLSDVGYSARPTFVDSNSDGDLDAFVGERNGNTLFVINNINGNQAPTATNLSAAETYTEGIALDLADIVVSDIDNTNITAILTLSDPMAGNLNAATSGTVTSVYNAGTGVWTASGKLTDVNALLASVTFTPAAFFNGNFTVSTSISDGVAAAITGSKSFTVIPGVVHITQSGGNTKVTEGGATDTYTVVLGSAPAANVTIALDNTNQQVNNNVSTLTFTPANWNIAQTVTVTAANDTAGEGSHTGVIQHTVSSPDTNYNNLALNPIIVVITDNDLPAADPAFTLISTNPFGLSDVGWSANPTLVDIDGDGDLDAFVGETYGNILFFRNTGTVSSPAFAAASTNLFGLSDVGSRVSPTFVDIDGDGDLDAFVGELYGNMLFFRNTGTARSPAFAAASTNPFGLTDVGYNARPTFVDIDGDGDLDAFVGETYGNTLFFRNTGTARSPLFSAAVANPFGLSDVGSHAIPTLIDIDDDGDLDAFVGSSNGNTLFFRNIGIASSPAFDAAVTNPFGLSDVGYAASPIFVDSDSDGDLDALIGNSDGNTLFFINNNNHTPTLVSPLVDQAIQYNTLGWSYDASASFSDGDSSDSLSYSASLANGDPLPAWIQIGATTGLMTGTPGFNDRDTYALNITATNTQGASVSAPLTVAVTGFNAGQLLVSTAGNDILAGSLSNDTVTYAYATAPVTVSLAITTQQNTIGAGSDTLTNIDNLMGSNYSDSLTGNGQNNVLDGGTGDDKLNGAGGADTMIGGRGNDTFTVNHVGDVAIEYLNKGTDKVSSNVTYTLPANVENLTLTGALAINGTGNDLSNILVGNTGNNLLKGLAGLDKLTGGAGADRFDFDALSDSVAGANRDVIADFNHAQGDLIDVSTIDANDSVAGDQAFTFIGNAAFSAAGQLRYNPVNGFIQGNVNNNLTADFEIKLTGAPSVVAADFVL
jgi:Rieske Fe-S protein